ncbi:MAG: hypothetical protein ACOCUR_00340 [Nanoarchaeota archaeon]
MSVRLRSKRSQVWVSAVLYTMVAAVSIAFILQAGMPLIEGMRDRSVFNKMKNQMMVLDQHIEQVAAEGRGSQRFVPFDIAQGDIKIDDMGLRWEMDTDTKIVEPRSSYRIGNLMISANSDVIAEEHSDHYVIENGKIRVVFSKNGTRDSPVTLYTGDFVQEMTVVETNVSVTPSFTFRVADDDASMTGMGYTSISRTGTLLGSSSFIAHMDTGDYSYDFHLTLDGEADFLRAEVKNFKVK